MTARSQSWLPSHQRSYMSKMCAQNEPNFAFASRSNGSVVVSSGRRRCWLAKLPENCATAAILLRHIASHARARQQRLRELLRAIASDGLRLDGSRHDA
jgi:hypothetical protein